MSRPLCPPSPHPHRLLRRERDDAQSQLDQLTSDRRQLQDDKGQLLRELAGRYGYAFEEH